GGRGLPAARGSATLMADEPRVYNLYGLRVASALPLAAEAQGVGGAGPVDVTVLRGDRSDGTRNAPDGELVAHQIRDGEPRYTITSTDAGYVVRFHGVC